MNKSLNLSIMFLSALDEALFSQFHIQFLHGSPIYAANVEWAILISSERNDDSNDPRLNYQMYKRNASLYSFCTQRGKNKSLSGFLRLRLSLRIYFSQGVGDLQFMFFKNQNKF